jgi:hypothetical protein
MIHHTATIITVATVDTYNATTYRAAPPLLFFCNEGGQANLFDTFKVLYHAHGVFRSVSFIELLQPSAGIFCAFETEPGFARLDRFTVSDNAIYSSRRFVGVITMTTVAASFFSEISHTDAAIHATWSD